MKVENKCVKEYVFDTIEELKAHVDVERYLEENYAKYPEDLVWAEPVEEDFRNICKFFGLHNVKTCWDVSCSQGSGASFEGTFYTEDMDYKGLKGYAPKDKELANLFGILEDAIYESYRYYDEDDEKCIAENKIISAGIYRCRHTNYCHKETMCITAYNEDEDEVREYADNVLNAFKDLANWFYNQLSAEYEHITSEDYILQEIVSNEIGIEEEYLKGEEDDK